MKESGKWKRKEAVALRYAQNLDAPTVLAKGKGMVAESIIERAKENGVPIQEDPSLVELLAKLNFHDQIPEDLYQAVAEVFAFIYKLDKEYGENK
ncbi:EscU/YscU/HrcU family type III secretion system export apparatus switch protein [Niallia sp. 01092]|uniref:EscU/YscU/HrcU family type III secretion system export apparatus switch protein n=1 Tax=unclassified Niallia TaxID=2837522 RepID=UPI003FCEF54D